MKPCLRGDDSWLAPRMIGCVQGTVALDRDWMLYAHRQHHMLFDALKRSEGARAQNLAVEHTEVAQMNMRLALERRAESEQVMPAIRLVVG